MATRTESFTHKARWSVGRADPRKPGAAGQTVTGGTARFACAGAMNYLSPRMNRSLICTLGLAGLLLGGSLIGLVGCAGKTGGGRGTVGGRLEKPVGVDYYVQAVNAYNAGDNNRAIVMLLEAIRQNPNLRMARSMLGDLYRSRGDYRQAIPNYERFTELDPYNYDAHYRLGLVYQLVNRFKDAAAAYLRALELNPQDWRSNMNLGLVYLALNQLDDAVNYLEKASKLNERNAAIWSNLGVAYDARGNLVMAESAYKRAIELDGSQSTTLLNLASNLLAQNKGADALAVMERAIQSVDNAPARKRYADALSKTGQYDGAVQQYDRAIKADPNYWPAITDKGFLMITLYRRGMELEESQRQAAIQLWQRSLALNPNQPRVRQALQDWSGNTMFGR
jgi:tetratricopeptide (TPR) repeat protein